MPLNARAFAALRATRARVVKAAGVARRPALWNPLRNGVLAAVEHAAVPFDTETRTVVDVGASRGQFAVFAAERFPSARIVCFEPLEDPRRRLHEVLGERVTVHGVALGAEAGKAEFNVSAQDDSSSLLRSGDVRCASSRALRIAARVTVPVWGGWPITCRLSSSPQVAEDRRARLRAGGAARRGRLARPCSTRSL